jgi:hypothetical protein
MFEERLRLSMERVERSRDFRFEEVAVKRTASAEIRRLFFIVILAIAVGVSDHKKSII